MIKISKKSILYSILILLSPFFLLIAGVFFNWFGSYIGPGEVSKFSSVSQLSKIISSFNKDKTKFAKKLSHYSLHLDQHKKHQIFVKKTLNNFEIKYNKRNTLITPGLIAGDSNAVDKFLKL